MPHKSSRSNDALARIGVYLMSVGLPKEHAEAQALEILNETVAKMKDADDSNLTGETLARVTSRFEDWLEYLCANAADVRGRPDSLAWHLRPILSDRPEIFLQHGVLPAEVCRAVRMSARAAVPEERRLAMPTQPVGELPAFFTRTFWRAVIEDVKLARTRLRHWREKER
ncbi:MAG: hypothetical protein HY706_03475 [Candidatus Hydrogenedentes bacterium]|nr:hypothetical protein [Candidatus Hydrogenedentota bacterium]